MQEINFSKNYDKLFKNKGFSITTIRGKTYPVRNKLNLLEDVNLKVKGVKVREAYITHIQFLKIKDIKLLILKEDISPVKCSSIYDFVKELDKHWRFIKVTKETEISLIRMVLLDQVKK